MYTLLLVGCILALTLCPLLLDAILVWKETRLPGRVRTTAQTPGLSLVTSRVH